MLCETNNSCNSLLFIFVLIRLLATIGVLLFLGLDSTAPGNLFRDLMAGILADALEEDEYYMIAKLLESSPHKLLGMYLI